MFPAAVTRSGNGYVQKFVVVALAAVVAFAALVVMRPTAAEAHSESVQVISCLGWSVELLSYDDTSANSVEIWVDGTKVTDIADFGTDYDERATWSAFVPHTLQVKVVAWDDPDGSEGWTFETTRTSVACPEPSIDIEKATNGFDADDPTGPEIEVGDTVTWTYVVTNTGDVALSDVAVTDNLEGAICTIGDLAAGAADTCTATGVAVVGQYANVGSVIGSFEGTSVTDTDPSHYIGVTPPPDPQPAIDIEKTTNGNDADTWPEAEILTVGGDVLWTYVVTNTGNVDLTDVAVTDNLEGAICTIGDLAAGAIDTCTATGVVGSVNYANTGTVVGSYVGGVVTDTDPSHYKVDSIVLGTAQLGDTVWLDTNKNGVQDAGEVGLSGACVDLTDADGNVTSLDTGTVPWIGFYKFVGLDAGVYTAAIDMTCVKSSYELTTAGSFTVTLEEGDEYLDADFGLYEPPTTTTSTTAPSTTPTTQPTETLPDTGVDSGALTAIAVGLLMLGGLAILATRTRQSTD